MIKLLLKKKAEILKEFEITGKKSKEINIGRGKKNHIQIPGKQVSEKHCVLRIGKESLEVEDLNSSFGTYVNDRKIHKENISYKDEIRVGDFIIKPVREADLKKQAFLTGIQGKMDGKKFEIGTGETKIGRSEEFNDIWIPKDLDKSVSRRHATVVYNGKDYIISDKRSRNRTFVNQRQISETDEVPLKENDEILIGKSIFRFIVGDRENYAYPKKAGIIWTRLLPKIRAAGFMFVGLAGLYLAYTGIHSIMIINERPPEYYLTDSGWRPENLSRYPGGYPMDELDITPSPAIGDITGNGSNEVVMSAPGGDVYAWNGEGELLWSVNIGESMLTSPQLADINNNGNKDVVVGSDDSRLYVLDGRTGQLIYRSPFLGGKVLFASIPLVADLDGNGFKDIVTVTDDNVICFIYSPVTGVRDPYYFTAADRIMSSPVLLRNRGGSSSVAVPTNGGSIYVFESDNPERRNVLDITRKINMYGGHNLVLNEINTVPAVADINNDGQDDIISAAGSYFMPAISGRTESVEWLYRIEPFSTLEPPLRYGSPVIGDFNGDGRMDVALAWANGKIMAVSGATGRELWDYTFRGSRNRILSSIALADFNKDGVPNPVVAVEDGAVFVVDGLEGGGRNPVIAQARLNAPITATPVLGDILGDGYLDVAVVTTAGVIRILRTPVRVFRNQVVWPAFRNTPDNSGVLVLEDKTGTYGVYAAVGSALFLGALAAVFLISKKRKKKRPGTVQV